MWQPSEYVQLTHGEGKNENPSWAPDGVHIVFASTRAADSQIYTMLADGTQLQQLTTTGRERETRCGESNASLGDDVHVQ